MQINKKQKFHLESDIGLLNDPNGLTYFKEKYYVFFQWNKFEKNHSYKEWGLFTSNNLICWDFKKSAIIPDQEYDLDGVYSGSSYVINNKLYIFYTGNRKKNNIRKSSQCLAISDDGIRFKKMGCVLETPIEYTEHFRDPKIFKLNNIFYMIIGSQSKYGKGAIAIAKSNDGLNWSYVKKLGFSNKYEMIECPDLINIKEKSILIFSPQKRDNEKDEPLFSFSCYKVIDNFSIENDLLNLDEHTKLLDYGFDFYAPQTFINHDKRIILYAWMSNMTCIEEQIFSQFEKNIHCLTIPRELKIINNKLHQMPIKELYSLIDKDIYYKKIKNNIKLKTNTKTIYMNLKFSNFLNNIKFSFKNINFFILYNYITKQIIIKRKNWVTKKYEYKNYYLTNFTEIEIWIDVSSIEIFINKGEVCFSSRTFPIQKQTNIEITGIENNKEIKIKKIIERCKL